MGTFVRFDPQQIQNYYESKRLTHSATGYGDLVLDNASEARSEILMAIQQVDSGFSWHDIKQYSIEEQKEFWTLREWLFCQVLVLAYLNFQSGQVSRQPPSGFKPETYNFALFGSIKPTSDIDVSVDGPIASYLIAVLEDLWLSATGKPCSRWDIEFYGDFSMVLDEKKNPVFLNSREFNSAADQILPYVGASILRNAETLEFPELDAFIAAHPEVPALTKSSWKQEAYALLRTIGTMTYDQQREQYYKYLGEAEKIRNSVPILSQDIALKVFLSMCKANLFRSENYILPSTVIHIVRDIQAKAPQPNRNDPRCTMYHAKLSTCAVGRFAYLASAMEQLGYMKRFSYDSDKLKKYSDRLEAAMKKYDSMSAGKRVLRTKRVSQTKRKTRGLRHRSKGRRRTGRKH
jgi:hypothetical protein